MPERPGISWFWAFWLFATSMGMYAFTQFFQEGVMGAINPATIYRKLTLTEAVEVDIVGAVLPSIVAAFCVIYVLKRRALSARTHLMILVLSVGSAASSHFVAVLPYGFSEGSIEILYGLHAWIVALIVFVTLSIQRKQEGSRGSPWKGSLARDWSVKGGDLWILYVLGYGYTVLSALVLDLVQIPLTTWLYIGARGTVDGILLSGLFAFLPLTQLAALANSRLLDDLFQARK